MTKNGTDGSYRILVVEDEALVRMMIVAMLEDLGHKVAGEAGRIEDAISLAQTAEFELAVLDVNLGGRFIIPVAQIIDGRKLPIIFSTGYSGHTVPAALRHRSIIHKPFKLESLEMAIKLAMAGDEPGG